jgi:hypothetical protein
LCFSGFFGWTGQYPVRSATSSIIPITGTLTRHRSSRYIDHHASGISIAVRLNGSR